MACLGTIVAMRVLFVLSALFALVGLSAGESSFTRQGVTVSVGLERDAGGPVVVATFQPRQQIPPLHLYSKDLKPGGAGLATAVTLAPGAPVRPRGPLSDDQPTHDLDGLAVYPDGATVTVRLPITSPAGNGDIPVEVRISYMACTAMTCLIPVVNAPLTVLVPGDGAAAAAAGAAPGASLADVRAVLREELGRKVDLSGAMRG